MRSEVVGRDDERSRLAAWLADRWAGPSTVPPACLVSGEAGVGKTVLVDAVAAAAARSGMHVRRAAGTPWPERPFRMLRLVAGGRIDVEEIRAELVGLGSPVLVVLDDLQWSDEATLDRLPALVAALAGDRVAVLGAYRGEQVPRDHRLRWVRACLRQQGLGSELAVPPLSGQALTDLITASLGGTPSTELAAAIGRRTDGLPFFVVGLATALAESGQLRTTGDRIAATDAAAGATTLPETIRDMVAMQVGGLGAGGRAALDVAAVLGGVFDTGTVSAVTGGDWPDELDRSGLVVASPDSPAHRGFRHVLVQEVLYAEVPWSRRRALHRAAADALDAGGDEPLAVARHLVAAREFDRARPALLAAAAIHQDMGAYRDAAGLLSTALQGWPDALPGREAVRERLARCHELAGDHAAAVVALERLADGGDPDVLRRLALRHEMLGDGPAARAARERAATGYLARGRPDESAAERLAIAAHLRSASDYAEALHVLGLAGTDARAAGRTDLRCRIDALRGNVLARMGRPGEGLPAIRAALETCVADGLSSAAAEIYQRMADSLEHAGDYRGALQAYDGAYDLCRVHGHTSTGQLCRACAAVVMFQIGRWDRVLDACSAVAADVSVGAHARAVAAGVQGLVLALRGRTAPARAALIESRTVARRIDLVPMQLLSTWGLALLDEADGRFEQAAGEYRDVVVRCRQTDERHYCVPILQFAAVRFTTDGTRADLAAVTELLTDAAARSGQPEARAALSHALGESALVDGAGTEARDHLRRATDEVRLLGLPTVEVLVNLRAAAAAEDRADAARLLRTARRTAQRLRSPLLRQRVSTEMARLGLTVSPEREASGLTPREAEVMQLVGAGHTSRAIAAQLHLSVRTVEMHVGNAVATLGCRSRAEATRRLAGFDT